MENCESNGHDPIVKFDWGIDGVRFALRNRNITVIVDTLRFSTAATTAIAHGFTIFPIGDREIGNSLAASIGAEVSGKPGEARYTISPNSYLRAAPGGNQNVVLYSPNGAACAALAGDDDIVYIGCFLNARALGRLLVKTAHQTRRDATIVAAGEQRAIDTGERIVYDKKAAYPVFAIEDYLASGAIINGTDMDKNAEARLCGLAYECAREHLVEFLFGSFSGRYLIENGLKDDISHAAQLNIYDIVPVVRQGKITALQKYPV
jgi:2-phosphosulfolactate phosphatase